MKLLRHIFKVASTVTFLSFLGFNIQVVAPQQCEEFKQSNYTDREIPCPDVNDECTWFRIKNGSQVSVESRFLNLSNNNIELQRNDRSRYGYGLFNVTTSQSDSFCYKVCPVESEYICDNCSDIIIDDKTNPPEVELCAGENISIAIVAPPIFNISEDYWGATLRLNGSNLDCADGKCCSIGDVRGSTVIYQCENMEETDSGLYFGHNLISCAGVSLEWCTQGVLINIINCSDDTNSDSLLPTTVAQTSSYSIYNNTSTKSLSITSAELTIAITTTTLLVPTTSSTPKTSNNGGQNIGIIAGASAGAGAMVIIIAIIVAIGCCMVYNDSQSGEYNVEEKERTDQRPSAVTSPSGLEESNV